MLIASGEITAWDHRTDQQITSRLLALSGAESGWLHWLKNKLSSLICGEAAIKMSFFPKNVSKCLLYPRLKAKFQSVSNFQRSSCLRRNISANIYFAVCIDIYLQADWTADTTQQRLLVALSSDCYDGSGCVSFRCRFLLLPIWLFLKHPQVKKDFVETTSSILWIPTMKTHVVSTWCPRQADF